MQTGRFSKFDTYLPFFLFKVMFTLHSENIGTILRFITGKKMDICDNSLYVPHILLHVVVQFNHSQPIFMNNDYDIILECCFGSGRGG